MKMMLAEEDPANEQFWSDDEDDSEVDSDEELQAAFARGDLKPGLVVLDKSEGSAEDKPLIINNVPLMELKLKQIKLPKTLGWVERLDIVNGMAPLAPEIALQVNEHKTRREREIKAATPKNLKRKSAPQPSLKSVEEDPVHNDFVRELNFYRQAQEAVLKCLPKLQELGVPTKRPEDYFAEMAKSDVHMQKVAKVLHKKQIITERAEKIKKVRQQKKIAKQTQVHALQEKQKAKRELNESVKRYRKGQKNALDFLDEKSSGRGKGNNKNRPMVNRRREAKNEKYGFGGIKKRGKWNTRESLDSFEDGGGGGKRKSAGFNRGKSPRGRGSFGGTRPGSRDSSAGGRGRGRGGTPGNGNRGGGNPGAKRPGKSARQKIKAKKN